MRSVVDRLAAETEYRRALADDPLATAAVEGYPSSTTDIAALLGGCPDDIPLDEVLKQSLNRIGLGKWT